MEIYIVRHGETIWNKQKLLQGRTDIELSEYGRELAVESGRNLENVPIDKIFSSPLKRAFETASLIRGSRDIEIVTDDRLLELCFGCYEGQNMSMLLNDKTQSFRYFFKQPELYEAPDDGESLTHLIERASQFMTEKIEPLEGTCERIMIVAHGALNKAIMTHIKKHTLNLFWSGGLQKNCNVIIVDYTDGKYSIIDETKLFYNEPEA